MMVALLIVGLIFIILQILFSNYVLGALYDLYSKTPKGQIKRLKSESKFIRHQLCRIINKQDKIKNKIEKLENHYDILQTRFLKKHAKMIEKDDEIIRLQKD